MRTLEILLQDPAINRWIKWVLILAILKRENPVAWASFLSLNRVIKAGLQEANERVGLGNVNRIGNGVSCALLMKATINNLAFPKDYMSIYVWMTLIKIQVVRNNGEKLQTFVKQQVSNSRVLKWIYSNKDTILFSLLSGQILSSYLSPTRKSNHKYLNASLKTYILNPIWINFSLGANDHAFNWIGLLKQYLKLQGILSTVNFFTSLKSKILDDPEGNIWSKLQNYLCYVFHKSNAYVNLIFFPNLLAIFSLAITSPMLQLIPPNYKKLAIKSYIKSIGFIASFITVYANSNNWIKDFGYIRENNEPNPRLISKSFLEGINIHLIRLILVSKWRALRDNHRSFKSIKSSTWNLYETLAMCIGTWNLMNIYDQVKYNHDKVSESIKRDRLMNGIKQIMD